VWSAGLALADRLAKDAAGFEAGDGAVDALRRDGDSLVSEQPAELLTAPGWVLFAQLQNPLEDVWRGQWLTDVAGPAAAVLKAVYSRPFIATGPAADRIRAEAKVTGGQT
jgi:hypothetical protein